LADLSRIAVFPAGVLDEKAAAVQALGVYARETLAHFAPYIEQTLAVLLRMSSYFHDDVREQAYEALSFLVAATTKAFPATEQGAAPTGCQSLPGAGLDIMLCPGCQLPGQRPCRIGTQHLHDSDVALALTSTTIE